MRGIRISKQSIFLLIGAILLLLLAFWVMSTLERCTVPQGPEDDKGALGRLDDLNTIYVGDKGYLRRRSVESYLFLGLDTTGERKRVTSSGESIQADVILLFVVDHEAKSYTVVQIDRDTMVDMDVLGPTGVVTGSEYAQLALAHAQGDGMEDSGQNCKKTVQKLLYGTKIDRYLSVTMDGVAVLSDWMDGVSVTLDRDYTELDPGYTAGRTVTLRGDAALNFVRARSQMSDPTNRARMERQRCFMEALVSKLASDTRQRSLQKLADALAPYLVTDCDLQEMSDSMEQFMTYTFEGLVSPVGEVREGEKYLEFHPDEKELQELVLRLFYQERE